MSSVEPEVKTRTRISGAELRELYVVQGLTIEAIAPRFGVAPTTIARRFADLEIRARRRGPAPRTRGDWPAPDRSVGWTAELAYAVGLIATDGCLSKDGRHLTVTSKDFDLLEIVQRCLGVTARITSTSKTQCYRLQWSDTVFYRWLIDVGLMPAKSLRLGPLRVPDERFRDFVRGCIDGDGSILTYVDAYNTFKNPRYTYTRVYVSLVSASPAFIEWFRACLQRLAGVSGDMGVSRSGKNTDVWRLRYAKRESLALIRWMYYSPEVPCLRRKREIAAPFLVPTIRPGPRGPGRPMVL